MHEYTNLGPGLGGIAHVESTNGSSDFRRNVASWVKDCDGPEVWREVVDGYRFNQRG